jgi:hypothetical protein
MSTQGRAHSSNERRWAFPLFPGQSGNLYRDGAGQAALQFRTSLPVAVEVGRTVTLNFNLALSAASQTVEVKAQQGLLSLENPNTTTTLESKTIASLPNPGQDLTYLTQFAQGALMNTAGSSSDAKAAGGYGNVEFNGLPATSNGYILDGYDSNDPWLGLNIGLSTNLVIGLDAVDQATVNTNSFSVDQGRYGAGAGELLHQVGDQQVSRRRLRDLERLAVQCGGLLSPRQRHAGRTSRKKPRSW